MDAMFGATNPPELFSTRNGLLLFSALEDNFDKGVLVIVPDLPDRPPRNRLAAWLKSPTREYKLRIIDTSWELIDDPVDARGLAWRQLDGRRLLFRSEHRPAARYLYFHYCIQVLRRAWKARGRAEDGFLDFMTNMASYFGGPPVVIWRKICCARLRRNWATSMSLFCRVEIRSAQRQIAVCS